LLKNGKPYGSVIPSDVHSISVKGLKLGDKVELQLITLTNRAPSDSQSYKSNTLIIQYNTTVNRCSAEYAKLCSYTVKDTSWKICTGHFSATVHPIHFVFGFR